MRVRLTEAERPVYFDYRGLDNHHWEGGHCVLGTLAPTTTWYFAEGTTRPGFEEWLCLWNPHSKTADVTITIYP